MHLKNLSAHIAIIKKFIPDFVTAQGNVISESDFWPGHFYEYTIRRINAPYQHTVCLYIDSRPILNPMYDASEVSLVEGVEYATGLTPVGYFLPGGKLITSGRGSDRIPYVECDSRYSDRYACLYLLR